jgi:hypothetical protein
MVAKIKRKLKKVKSNYFKPTPKKWRQIGDALLAVALYAQTQESLNGYSTFMQVVSVLGIVGKFLTNFFVEEEVKQ